MTQHTLITPSDIVDLKTFEQRRPEWRSRIIALKKNRRVHVGPDITFYFESKETLVWQIQEMLFIEKGGEEQLHDELLAYNPLVPMGHELVATVMIEIADLARRHKVLRELSYIDQHIFLTIGDHTVQAIAEDDIDRTDAHGKTSSIHFVRFKLSDAECTLLRDCSTATLSIRHPNYGHSAMIPASVMASLIQDL